ncbi:MAG: aminotransferase class I/II-fold pyridoxal phosphate-dependent enzyme [Chlorobi bacterium]|nr:aminotransferase class I/II-fold pyridoxal phosphate-dependent enzyme [Chlorobiota bacterium]
MIRPKDPNIKTSIFAVMTKEANKHNAVNLSQGFPDFGVSEELISLVNKYMKSGYNQYAPMPGVRILREKLSEKIEKQYGRIYNPETEITITAGGTQALHSAISAIVNEGDEVIIFEPAYDSYAPVVRLNGGRPVYVRLKYPDYSVDWEKVNKMINSNTKLIILNTPQNPSGKVFSEDDMNSLKKLVGGTKILILSDEVYEHIIFDGKEHNSIAKYPELAERSILVFSFGKMYHATGWKTGYFAAPEKITEEIRKIHQFTVFSANTPVQYAIAEYLDNEDAYLNLPEFYQKKRDFFNSMLKDIGFDIVPAGGTYFQTVNFSELTDETDMQLALRLTERFKIAAIPMSSFYHNEENTKTLRFCFAKKDDVLKSAAERLADFYAKAKKQLNLF